MHAGSPQVYGGDCASTDLSDRIGTNGTREMSAAEGPANSYSQPPQDRLASELRGFGPLGILAVLVIAAGQQRAVTREPRQIVGPQPICIEASDLAKGVKAATVRVAGEVAQFLQLAEDGEIDVRAKGPLRLGRVETLRLSNS